MSLIPILLNALTVTKARVVTPGTGVWLADLDIDLDITGIMPSGPAVLTIGGTVMTGTIDPRGSGKFGSKGHVQLVGGGGGWDKAVLPQHFQSDAGVLSTQVYSATAAVVGEVVVDTLPTRLGTHYVRSAGPASRVLKDVDWYVTPAGVTTVGPRVPLPLDITSADILEWDPDQRKAVIATDTLVLPGTLLTDLRFGVATVRDVEQTWGEDGARCTVWCATSDVPAIPGKPASEVAGTRLARALGAVAREACGVAYLRRYRYRVVIQGADKRVTLQAVNLLSPAPPILLQVDIWPGIVGHSVLVVPGTEVSVVFVDGDPAQPVVVGFSNKAPIPLESKIDAVRIALGTVAADPVAKSVEVVSTINALQAQFAALAAWVAANTAFAWTTPGLLTSSPALATALATGSTAVPIAAALIPSTKTFTD